jgi:hypothetical protein
MANHSDHGLWDNGERKLIEFMGTGKNFLFQWRHYGRNNFAGQQFFWWPS